MLIIKMGRGWIGWLEGLSKKEKKTDEHRQQSGGCRGEGNQVVEEEMGWIKGEGRRLDLRWCRYNTAYR